MMKEETQKLPSALSAIDNTMQTKDLRADSGGERGRPLLSVPCALADFVEWIEAAEPSLPWPKGTLRLCLPEQHLSKVDEPDKYLLQAIRAITRLRGCWTGTATELKREMKRVAPHLRLSPEAFDVSSAEIGTKLRQIIDQLLTQGVGLRFKRSGKGRKRVLQVRNLTNERLVPSDGRLVVPKDGRISLNPLTYYRDFQRERSNDGPVKARNRTAPFFGGARTESCE